MFLPDRFLRRSFSTTALSGLVILLSPTRTALAFAGQQAATLSTGVGASTHVGTSMHAHPAPPEVRVCQPAWLPTFGGEPGLDGDVLATAVFDDGHGSALYAGGSFEDAAGVPVSRLAKWNGSSWSNVGGGLGNTVHALTVFDDGTGPALYVGGFFTTAGNVAARHVAKWNGSSWSALGSGLGIPNSMVYALAVFDDGSGPALYAGGSFTSAGGVSAERVARWNGSSWSALGSGMDNTVRALTVFDDGSGPALFASGEFTTAGGLPANHIARWNGSSWSTVGTGADSPIWTLSTFDDGGGNALYAGGAFTTAGGVAASHIAKWNGSNWSALGVGADGAVWALTAFDDGGGTALYAGGFFNGAGGFDVNLIAKWNGSNWSPLGTGMNNWAVWTLGVFDDGGGPELFAGGNFTTAGGIPANRIAKWEGSSWHAQGGNGLDNNVLALTTYDDGHGAALIAGGSFTRRAANGQAAKYIASWNGSDVSALGLGTNDIIRSSMVFDDGGGPALVVGGDFTSAGDAPANSIAKWDGASWSALGSGVSNTPHTSHVLALAVFDDGAGPALYVGGDYYEAGGAPAYYIAKWNGSTWSPLGEGMNYGQVDSLAVFDDGNGTALYAGGHFTQAGGATANHIAKWDGASWSAVGAGIDGVVYALTVFDDGSGPALFAGGSFGNAGSVAANNVAKWDGANWSALGSGAGYPVYSLAACDDGSGPALYAGGTFPSAGGIAANFIARWDGASWSALGSGTSGSVFALNGYDDGGGSALYAGGVFANVPDSGDSFLAKWSNPSGCGAPGRSFCAPGSGGVIACPCGNPSVGARRGCNNSANTGGAQLGAVGMARITYDTVVFTTHGEKTSATSIVVQGDNVVSNGVVFGQGARCVAGTLKRLYVKTAVAGSITAPQGSELRVHARSASLGDTIAPGAHRYYGVYYRDPTVLGGCPSTSTFNITQQLDVLWGA